MSTIFIGIAGGTGSGKTTLTRHLKEHFGDAVTVIGHDSYYKRQDGKTYEERSKVNYDHPDAFETSLLVANAPSTPMWTTTARTRPLRPSPPRSSSSRASSFPGPDPARYVRH